MQDPKLTIDRATEGYKRLGYSNNLINQRLKTIEVRKELTDEWKVRGVEEGIYRINNNINPRPHRKA